MLTKILSGNSERKRPLRTPRRERKYNIKTDLREVGCVGVDWIEISQETAQWRVLVNKKIKFQVQ
jgi:hypothetical protein